MSDTDTTAKEDGGAGFPIKMLFKILPVIIALALGIGATVVAAKKKPELFGLPKSQEQLQAEVDTLTKEVGKLIDLPADEKPTVATVTDIEKVKEQQFFKNAKNNDRVLIYTNARKAILYRPTEKRIIEVGAVNINQQPQPTGTPSGSPAPSGAATPTPTGSATATPQATPTPGN